MHSTPLYLIIALFLFLYNQLLLRVQFLALCISPCMSTLCLPLLTHTIIHHPFADDLQLQMSAPPDKISAPLDQMSELLHSMQSCISDVNAWATASMLRLNDNKTELMLVTCRRTKHLHSLPTSITIGNAQIPFKQSVKFGFYIRLSSYYESACLQYCSDMLLRTASFGIYL